MGPTCQGSKGPQVGKVGYVTETEPNKNRIEVKARVNSALYEYLRQAAFAQKRTHQQFIVSALEAAVKAHLRGEKPTAPAQPSKNEKFHQLLDQVLAGGDAQQFTVVTQLLQSFARRAAPEAERTKKGGRT